MIEDVDGNRFLDFNAGHRGHVHRPLPSGGRRRDPAQAGQLIHYCSSDFYPPVYAELCERLVRSRPSPATSKVFLTNSGTEAVEASIKLARHRPAGST